MAKALINPNNGAIDTRYDPHDIDDPFSYRARDGFMGIGPLWSNNDDGTVYMQGHIVIPNPWGNVSTNGTTTTTTVDTTDKDGGDEVRPCGEGDCWSLRQAAICFRAEYYFYKEQLNNLLEGKPIELKPNEYLQMFIRSGKTPPSYEGFTKNKCNNEHI